MKTIEIEGFFWLPSRPGDEASGRLTFDSVEGGKLALIGSLDTSQNVSRILGRASDGFYTLDDCFVLHEQVSGITKQTINVGRIYRGVAYEEAEEPVFDRFDIGLANLVEWARPPELAEDIDFGSTPEGNGHRFTVMLEPWEERQIAFADGNLRLLQSRGVTGDGLRERTLTQDLSFSLQFDKTQSLAEVVDVASDLQDLVTIGTDRVAAYDYVHLYHADLYNELSNGERIPVPARLLMPWFAQVDDKENRPVASDMAFTLDDIGGMEGVSRWLGIAAKYRSMLGHVMATKYVRMLVDVKFSFRVAALHGLHREWKGFERNFHVALTQLAVLAGAPFSQLVPDIEAWCSKVKCERNNIAHHYGRPAHTSNTDLYYSSEVAYWLFVLCMLRLADAPVAVFERIVKCPSFEWVQAQLSSRP